MADTKDYKWSTRMDLYRGLKNVTPENFKKEQPIADDESSKYGPGAYFHDKLGYNGALQWIADKGMVVKYRAKKPLLLLEYKEPTPRQEDLMSDLDDKYDGIYLSSYNQEAGIQIILRDGGAVKPVGYWPIDFKFDKYGDPLPVHLPANKMKRKFAAANKVLLAALRRIVTLQ